MSKTLKSNPAKTVLTITLGFTVVYLAWDQQWAIYTALGIGVLGLISSFLAGKIEYLWFGLAKVLGYIVPNILLSLVFYVFLFPMAIVAKVFSKRDPLTLKNKESTFTTVNKLFEEKDFKHPW